MIAPSFEYTAVDRAGEKRRGVATAASKAEAYRKVAGLGLTPLTIRPVGVKLSSRFGSSRIRTKDLSNFTYQLGVLVSARIPISEGLINIAQQEKDVKFKALVMDLAKRIQAGEQLAVAMEAHQEALGEVYVETIRAAEKSGNLPKVLEHLTDMLEKGQEQTRMVRGAIRVAVLKPRSSPMRQMAKSAP